VCFGSHADTRGGGADLHPACTGPLMTHRRHKSVVPEQSPGGLQSLQSPELETAVVRTRGIKPPFGVNQIRRNSQFSQ
jgi:hypothetical protein